MKKFILLVICTVGVGLAIRFTINRPRSKAKPPQTQTVEKVQPPPSQPAHDHDSHDIKPPEPAPPPPAPEPPRIKGSTLVSDTGVHEFGAAPGLIYYCQGGSVMAQPKTGGSPERVGDCDGQVFDWHADAQAIFYCTDDKLLRITHGGDGSHVVLDNVTCIMMGLDSKFAYYVVPGWDQESGDERTKNPGLYRVARGGGTPERIHATRPSEQFNLAVDDDALWVGAYFGGTIGKLARTVGAKAKTVVTGQKGTADMAVDATYVYWQVEGPNEVRRRKKTGGKVEVIGHDVDVEQVVAADGHVYWFEADGDKGDRLMHLAPGAANAESLAKGLHSPSMRADSEGVYVNELDRDGIFMFKR